MEARRRALPLVALECEGACLAVQVDGGAGAVQIHFRPFSGRPGRGLFATSASVARACRVPHGELVRRIVRGYAGELLAVARAYQKGGAAGGVSAESLVERDCPVVSGVRASCCPSCPTSVSVAQTGSYASKVWDAERRAGPDRVPTRLVSLVQAAAVAGMYDPDEGARRERLHAWSWGVSRVIGAADLSGALRGASKDVCTALVSEAKALCALASGLYWDDRPAPVRSVSVDAVRALERARVGMPSKAQSQAHAAAWRSHMRDRCDAMRAALSFSSAAMASARLAQAVHTGRSLVEEPASALCAPDAPAKDGGEGGAEAADSGSTWSASGSGTIRTAAGNGVQSVKRGHCEAFSSSVVDVLSVGPSSVCAVRPVKRTRVRAPRGHRLVGVMGGSPVPAGPSLRSAAGVICAHRASCSGVLSRQASLSRVLVPGADVSCGDIVRRLSADCVWEYGPLGRAVMDLEEYGAVRHPGHRLVHVARSVGRPGSDGGSGRPKSVVSAPAVGSGVSRRSGSGAPSSSKRAVRYARAAERAERGGVLSSAASSMLIVAAGGVASCKEFGRGVRGGFRLPDGCGMYVTGEIATDVAPPGLRVVGGVLVSPTMVGVCGGAVTRRDKQDSFLAPLVGDVSGIPHVPLVALELLTGASPSNVRAAAISVGGSYRPCADWDGLDCDPCRRSLTRFCRYARACEWDNAVVPLYLLDEVMAASLGASVPPRLGISLCRALSESPVYLAGKHVWLSRAMALCAEAYGRTRSWVARQSGSRGVPFLVGEGVSSVVSDMESLVLEAALAASREAERLIVDYERGVAEDACKMLLASGVRAADAAIVALRSSVEPPVFASRDEWHRIMRVRWLELSSRVYLGCDGEVFRGADVLLRPAETVLGVPVDGAVVARSSMVPCVRMEDVVFDDNVSRRAKRAATMVRRVVEETGATVGGMCGVDSGADAGAGAPVSLVLLGSRSFFSSLRLRRRVSTCFAGNGGSQVYRAHLRAGMCHDAAAACALRFSAFRGVRRADWGVCSAPRGGAVCEACKSCQLWGSFAKMLSAIFMCERPTVGLMEVLACNARAVSAWVRKHAYVAFDLIQSTVGCCTDRDVVRAWCKWIRDEGLRELIVEATAKLDGDPFVVSYVDDVAGSASKRTVCRLPPPGGVSAERFAVFAAPRLG